MCEIKKEIKKLNSKECEDFLNNELSQEINILVLDRMMELEYFKNEDDI